MKKLPWLILLSACLLAACKHRNVLYPWALQQAERCWREYPDSALRYLSLLKDSIRHQPEEIRMYYHLLTIGTEDKLYMEHTSDSLIRAVVRFYEDYGDADKLMLAYYYQGCVWRDMNDAPRAIDSYRKALKVGKHSGWYDLHTSIYSQIGVLFAYQGLYDESLRATRTALDICRQHRDSLHYPFFLRNIGRIWGVRRHKDSTFYYYREALRQARHNKDTSKVEIVSEELGAVYREFGETDSAKALLLGLRNKEGKDGIACLYLGQIYAEEGKVDSARIYLNRIPSHARLLQRMSLHEELAKLDRAEERYKEALEHAFQSMALRDSVSDITQTEEVARVNALYDYHHTEEENKRLEQENRQKLWLICWISGGFVLLGCGGVGWMRRKRKEVTMQQRQIRRLEEEQFRRSKEYKEEIRKQQSELEVRLSQAEEDKNTALANLLETQKALLALSAEKDQIEQKERDLLVTQLQQSAVYALFHKAANEEVRITDKDWMELQAIIDRTYGGFTNRLYSLYPHLSEIELHICCLIKIQISPTDIARIVGRSNSAVSMTRSRLYRKIHNRQGTAGEFDKFIIDL